MKLRNKFLAALCLALMACLAAQVVLPANLGAVATAQAASKVKLNKTKATLYSAEKLQLELSGTNKKVKWSTSDRKVAKVNAEGLVTGVKAGKATITAKVGKKKYTCKLTVKSPLSANMTEVKLVKGESVDVRLTYKYTGSLSVKWDNAAVIKCKMSGKWDDTDTTMSVKALAVGKATIKITNSETKDVLKLKVTVTSAKQKKELHGLMGKTVKSANKQLSDELKSAKSGYANKYFSVKLNSLKRINKITLSGGKGKYKLFSVYPGMKHSTAVSKLKKQGWKLAKKSSKGNVYLNDSDPSHAIKLAKKSSKVSRVTYYIP